MRDGVLRVLGRRKPDPNPRDGSLSFANLQVLLDLRHGLSPNANNVRLAGRRGPQPSQRSRIRSSQQVSQRNPRDASGSFPTVAIHLPHPHRCKIWRQEDH